MDILKGRKILFYGLLVLTAVGCAIYANSFQSGLVFDGRAILDDPRFHSLENLKARFFHPINSEDRTRIVAFLSFTLNYILHGEDLFGYHLVNIIIHIMNAAFVWWLWRLLMSSLYYSGEKRDRSRILIAGFLGALFFLAHPIQTQAVTYVYQRIAALVTLFYLATVCLYVKARVAQGLSNKQKFGLYLVAAMTCICAMFTKETAFTLPFSILLIEGCFLQERHFLKSKKFWIICLSVIFFALIIPALLSFNARGVFGGSVRLSNDHMHVKPGAYFLTQWRVWLKYLQIIMVPVGQNLDHDVYLSQTIRDVPTLAAGFIIACVFILGVLLFRKNRIIAFGIFWMFLTAAVECSFIPIRHVIFEHRMYLPMVGVSLAFAGWLYSMRFNKRNLVFVVILLSVLGILTVQRNYVWRNGITMWTDVIKKAPMESRGYDNLGSAYLKEGKYDLALKDFFIAQMLDPTNKETYNNIGLVYLKQQAWPLALRNFERAVEINPQYETAYNNMGLVKEAMGDDKGALENFVAAAYFGANLLEPRLNIARIAEKSGDFDRALKMCLINQDVAPNNLENLRQLTRFASVQGQSDLADQTLEKILGLAHSSKEILMTGMYFVQAGLAQEGLVVLKKGMRRFPRDEIFYIEAGKVLGNYNQFDDAIAVWRVGMRVAPEKKDEFLTLIDQAQRLKKSLGQVNN